MSTIAFLQTVVLVVCAFLAEEKIGSEIRHFCASYKKGTISKQNTRYMTRVTTQTVQRLSAGSSISSKAYFDRVSSLLAQPGLQRNDHSLRSKIASIFGLWSRMIKKNLTIGIIGDRSEKTNQSILQYLDTYITQPQPQHTTGHRFASRKWAVCHFQLNTSFHK